MIKFRKKPVVIEAMLFDNSQDSRNEINELARVYPSIISIEEYEVFIYTLEGIMKAQIGDYIIKGIKGELYPCKPDIFKASYDLA